MIATPAKAHTAALPLARSRTRLAGHALPIILGIGLVLRLLLWTQLGHGSLHIWDERDYDTLASNLVQYGEFTFDPEGTPTSLRPPLYPALLAAVYSVAGDRNWAAARLLQIVLSLLTVAVVYKLARVVATPRTANWAAGIVCFYPSLLIFGNLLLTETLFTLLLTTACYGFVLAMQRCSLKYVVISGVVLGLAALTRSVVWLAPPFLAIFLAIASRGNWTERAKAAGAVVLAFWLTILPWSVRNTRLQQTFVAIDVMGGRNFMMGNYQHTPLYRSWDAISIEGENSWAAVIASTNPRDQRYTQGHVDKLALRHGLTFVSENPGLTVLRCLVKFIDFWGLERELIAGAGRGYFDGVSKRLLGVMTVFIVAGYAALMLFGIFGVFLAGPLDRRAHWLFLCVIGFICGMHVAVFGHSRYHLPLIPLMAIYAAGAITQVRTIRAQGTTLGFVAALVSCGALVAGWIWNLIVVDWDRVVGFYERIV